MSNPLIDEIVENSVIPQVEIALPTRGVFYPRGEVLDTYVDPENLVIHPISILDESTFADPLMMISGHAIGRMVRRVCPGILDPGKLCELDIQAILIASRIASHGPEMNVEHDCENPDCKHRNVLKIDLNNHILNFASYTPTEFSAFQVELPVVKQTVMLRPMLYQDSVDMAISLIRSSSTINRLTGGEDKPLEEVLTVDYIDAYQEQFEKTLTTNIAAIVASIYWVEVRRTKVKVTDPDMIDEWILRLPSEDTAFIADRIKQLNADIRERSKTEYQCQKCGTINKFYLELDPQKLFTTAGRSDQPKESSAVSKNIGKTTGKRSKASQRLS